MPFWSRKPQKPSSSDTELLALRAEVQSLRLTLQEREAELQRLRQQGERAPAQVEALLAARLEALFQELAAPVAQLLLQGALIEKGQAVAARDMWLVAQRLIAVLKAQGVEICDPLGASVRFDPDRHMSLGAPMQAGQPALVRLPGVRYRGRILHKAGVVPAEEADHGGPSGY